jgi:L-ascorbate metabolism protein UlaG (beta-lactamase superfamily)
MKITKLGHSSLLVKEGKAVLAVDPGKFGAAFKDQNNINAVILSHEHFDHLDVALIKSILKNNPKAIVVSNSAVGAILEKEGIAFTKVEDHENTTIAGVTIEAFGNEHVLFGEGRGKCQNTGYLIAGKLFFPGDAYAVPEKLVAVLALPVGGPWLNRKDVIEYMEKVRPRAYLPIHDGFDTDLPELSKLIAEKTKIKFIPLPIGKEVVIE